MTIKTTIGALSSPTLSMALQKLNGAQVNTRTAYRFKKLHDAFNASMKQCQEKYKKDVVEVYAEKDEKNEIIPEQSPWGFKLKEGTDQVKFDEANKTFHDQEVVIPRPPLALSELTDVKISAAELTALNHFLADPEDTEIVSDNVAQMRR